MNILPATLRNLQQELTNSSGPEAARNIIAEYVSFFGLPSLHNELWMLTSGAITNEELSQYASTKERQDLIFFFEFTKMFMEAVYTLYGKQQMRVKEQ